jgi:hypothetical protein
VNLLGSILLNLASKSPMLCCRILRHSCTFLRACIVNDLLRAVDGICFADGSDDEVVATAVQLYSNLYWIFELTEDLLNMLLSEVSQAAEENIKILLPRRALDILFEASKVQFSMQRRMCDVEDTFAFVASHVTRISALFMTLVQQLQGGRSACDSAAMGEEGKDAANLCTTFMYESLCSGMAGR